MQLFIDGEVLSGGKSVGRTREVSEFTKTILEKNITGNQTLYVSHKEWLDSLGVKALTMTSASIKNGCRYSLKKHGFKVVAKQFAGEGLERLQESDPELTETSVVYVIQRA